MRRYRFAPDALAGFVQPVGFRDVSFLLDEDLKQNAGNGPSVVETGVGAELFAYTLGRS
jgi:hypothetical protein